MNKYLLSFTLLILSTACSIAQNAYYGSIYINSVDSVLLRKVMNMEKQKDSEIINVINFSKNEKQQLVALETFLMDPFAQNVSTPLDFNIIHNAFEKYYQASKIQLMYDLDITAQPGQISLPSEPIIKNSSTGASVATNFSFTNDKYYFAKPTLIKPEKKSKKAVLAAKDETERANNAIINFMTEFKANVHKTGELQIFFPQTCNKLKYTDVSQFPDLGNSFKKVFNEDLRNIFSNLLKYIDQYPTFAVPDLELSYLKSNKVQATKMSDYYFPMKIIDEVFTKVSDGYNPVSLINLLDKKYYSSSLLPHPQKSIQEKIEISFHCLNLIQSALRDTVTINKGNSNFWITFEQYNQLKPKEKRYFYGFLYQKDVPFFNQYLNLSRANGDYLINNMEPMVVSVLEQLTALQEFLNWNSGKGNKDNYKKFLELYSNLLANNIFVPSEAKSYFQNSNEIIHLYENSHNYNYTNSLFYIENILSEILMSRKEFTTELGTLPFYFNFISDIANSNNNHQMHEIMKKYVRVEKSEK